MNRLLLSLCLVATTGACATILDFQDPTDRPTEGDGLDAQVPEASTSTTLPADGAGSSSSSSSSSTSSSSGSSSPDASSDAADASGVHDAADASGVHDAADGVDADAGSDVTPKECTCVPHAPVGWRGPFVVAEQSGSTPSCLGDYPVTAYSGQLGAAAAPASCSCSCGSPMGVACSAPSTSFYTDATCSTPACHVDATAHACGDAVLCDVPSKKVAAVSFGSANATGGTCAPSASAEIAPASWQRSIRLCAPLATAADCTDGVCQPTPSPLFDTNNRCVIQDGDLPACPAAYPARRVYYAGGSDTRACSPCQCDAPTGVTCDATAGTSKDGTCKDTPVISTPSACLPMPLGGRVVSAPGVPQGGSCVAKGGQPIGAFDLGRPSTICCLE